MAAVLMVFIAMLLLLLPSGDALTRLEARRFKGNVAVTRFDDDYWLLESNGIPDHEIGTFPGSGNPNSVATQTHSVRIAKNPSVSATPTCLPMGPIGYAKNGVPIFNPLNSQGQDAVSGPNRETFDGCNGHPNQQGTYHYHQDPVCLSGSRTDKLIGVALDGFPIYGNTDCQGNVLTSADLDICHGRYENGRYRYRLTVDYPYVMGCFKGTVSPDIPSHMLSEERNCKTLSVTDTRNVNVNLPCTRSSRKIDELYDYLQSYKG